MKLKFDLHIHSEYSHDSTSKIKSILKRAKKEGLDGIAITDHEEFIGSQIAQKYANSKIIIIPGQEINTEIGDIIGLFLKKKIDSKEFVQVIKEIKKQKGLVVLPHPARFHILTTEVLNEIDAIEAFNSKSGKEANKMGQALALKLKKPFLAGSDAHNLFDIGKGVTIIDADSKNLEDIKKAILNKKISLIEKQTNKFLRLYSFFLTMWRRHVH